MKINLAEHFGMCFGVRDALKLTDALAAQGPVTILGQLVHNPRVDEHLDRLGVRRGDLDATGQAGTERVVITAHGAAESVKQAWRDAGFAVSDTTCPLVHKAHRALDNLVRAGYSPVVVGVRGHVEVEGLTRDYPNAVVILTTEEVVKVPREARIGVVSQTTQPVDRVEAIVDCLRARDPEAEVRWIDTVCHPTKDRQAALEALCAGNDTVVAVGGKNSNNTRELAQKARERGCRAYHIEGPDDLDPAWFEGSERVGVTAGTSTLPETVHAVVARLEAMAAALQPVR